MAWSWKRIALITIAVVVGLQVLGFCVYLYFANTINENIRAAIVEYIRSRARVEASSASQGKLMIDIGDIDYTYVTGSLDIDDLSVVYRDSTLDSGSIIALDVPTIAISGITPWDIIDGGGVSFGSIRVKAPRVAMRDWQKDSTRTLDTSATHNDSALVRLPRIPNVDSVLRHLFVGSIPTYVQPLSIDEVVVEDLRVVNESADHHDAYSGELSGLTIRFGPVRVDADDDAQKRPLGDLAIDVVSWKRTLPNGGHVRTHGLHVAVNDKDSSLIVDSVSYMRPDGYTYEARGVNFSYRTQILTMRSFVLGPTLRDDAFFAAQRYNGDRFRISGGPITLRAIDFAALSRQEALHVEMLDVDRLSIDILSNKRLRNDPKQARPKMLNELAQAIPFVVAIDSIRIGNAGLVYGERWPHSATPATLRWSKIRVLATHLMNRTENTGTPFRITASGSFMNGAPMSATFTIPLMSRSYELIAQGSLGALDVTQLNSFLPVAENIRIRSGKATSAAFSFVVRGRTCTGTVRPRYTGLKIDKLDAKTKESGGILNSLISFVANTFVLRTNNDGESYRDGTIAYTLPSDAAIMQTIWFPVRAGLGNAAGL